MTWIKTPDGSVVNVSRADYIDICVDTISGQHSVCADFGGKSVELFSGTKEECERELNHIGKWLMRGTPDASEHYVVQGG